MAWSIMEFQHIENIDAFITLVQNYGQEYMTTYPVTAV